MPAPSPAYSDRIDATKDATAESERLHTLIQAHKRSSGSEPLPHICCCRTNRCALLWHGLLCFSICM